MSKLIKYISILFCCTLSVACSLEEIGAPDKNTHDGPVEFLVRPLSFTSYSLSTKTTKALSQTQLSEVERKIATAYFLAFDHNGDRVMLETLNVSNNTIPSKSIRPDFGDSKVTVCFIANVPYDYVSQLTHIDRLTDTPLPLTYAEQSSTGFIGIPQLKLDVRKTPDNAADDVATQCFPMFGISNEVSLSNPSSSQIVVELERLFAKVQVIINLDLSASGEIGVEEAYFEFNKYTLLNLPSKLRLTEGKTLDDNEEFVFTENSWIKDSKAFIPETVVDFSSAPFIINDDENATNGHLLTFYVPEYVLLPDPVKVNENSSSTDKDKQKSKPELLVDGTIPVIIALNGNYHSVFGEDIDMTYSIYLGEDNYQSFSLIRNTLYTNNITIRGVAEADNRVEMKYAGFRVGFPHSVQMDAHFNVRPLRLQFTDEFKQGLEEGLYTHGEIRIEILPATEGATQPTWLALERPIDSQIDNNNTVYSKGYTINGEDAPYPTKRRYFTTNLISDLNNKTVSGGSDDPSAGASVVFNTANDDLDPFSGETITWVYVDEYNTRQADATREAIIAVTFTMDGQSEGVTKKMLVRQSAVYPITFDNHTYGIELFEEYTMNYDSDEHYDDYESGEDMGFVTNVNGIKWGLEKISLSRNKPALQAPAEEDVVISVTDDTHQALKPLLLNGINLLGDNIEILNTFITPMVRNEVTSRLKELDSYYDFYTSDDLESGFLSGLLGSDGIRDFDGFLMNVEIIHTILQLYSSENGAKLNGMVLDEHPLSAIAYCYNKNKRNDNGEVVKLNADGSLDISNYHWYAPAIKEIEGIMKASYSNGSWLHPEFETFANNMYWSCQPSYLNNRFEVNYDADSQWTLIGRQRQRTGGSDWWPTYDYVEIWRALLNAGYTFNANGAYLEDDTKRARATQYIVGDNSSATSHSAHTSKLLKIQGEFSGTHSVQNTIDKRQSFTKNDVLDNLTSLEYIRITFDYLNSLRNYLSSPNWSKSGVYPEGDAELTPEGEQDRGVGNLTRDQVKRVRCVYYDHNYTKATRTESTSGLIQTYKNGYQTTLSR